MILLLITGIVAAFFLPVAIGLIRNVDGVDRIVGFTLLGVFTAGAGWLGALFLACTLPKRVPPLRYVIDRAAQSGPSACPACGQRHGHDHWPAAS